MKLRPLAYAASALAALGVVAVPAAQAQDQADLQGLLRDTEIEAILHQDADPIFRAAGLDPKTITIALIGDKTLNAFTAAGKFMGINTGLILQTENPNQLQGVMAHETGHIAGGHAVRGDEMSAAGLKPMLLTLGIAAAAMMAGGTDFTDAAAALAASAPAESQIGQLAYSREQEARADQAAAGFLEKAGESGQGLVDFFNNFRYDEVFSNARQYAFFQDHPLSSERIDLLQSRVEAMPHWKTTDSPEAIAQHEIMKAKILGFMDPGKALSKYKDGDNSVPARYARSIALFQEKSPDQALKILETLITDQPDNPYFWELKGQILFEFNRIPEAEVAQRKSVALKSDAPLLWINLGQTLVAEDDPAKHAEGIADLKRAISYESDNQLAWHLLAKVYGEDNQQGLSLWATAEEYYAGGDLTGARRFATRARSQLAQNTPEWRASADILSSGSPGDNSRSPGGGSN